MRTGHERGFDRLDPYKAFVQAKILHIVPVTVQGLIARRDNADFAVQGRGGLERDLSRSDNRNAYPLARLAQVGVDEGMITASNPSRSARAQRSGYNGPRVNASLVPKAYTFAAPPLSAALGSGARAVFAPLYLARGIGAADVTLAGSVK